MLSHYNPDLRKIRSGFKHAVLYRVIIAGISICVTDRRNCFASSSGHELHLQAQHFTLVTSVVICVAGTALGMCRVAYCFFANRIDWAAVKC